MEAQAKVEKEGKWVLILRFVDMGFGGIGIKGQSKERVLGILVQRWSEVDEEVGVAVVKEREEAAAIS